MATARMTLGSVFGFVTNTANALGDLAGTLGDGVGMVNKFVAEASIDQRDRAILHRKTFRSTILEESRMEMSVRDAEVVKFCDESALNKALYDKAVTYLPDSIFDETAK